MYTEPETLGSIIDDSLGCASPGASQNHQYSEDHGDLVSRLTMAITRVTIWIAAVICLLTRSPDPPTTLRDKSLVCMHLQQSFSFSWDGTSTLIHWLVALVNSVRHALLPNKESSRNH